jgi:transposase-like protein
MSQRITISRAELEQRYVHQGQTMAMIAADLGCSVATVSNFLRRYAITTRDGRFRGCDIPRDLLVQLYSVERLRVRLIAERFGVQPATISNWRKRYGIPERPRLGVRRA